jgi:hypothetical protein
VVEPIIGPGDSGERARDVQRRLEQAVDGSLRQVSRNRRGADHPDDVSEHAPPEQHLVPSGSKLSAIDATEPNSAAGPPRTPAEGRETLPDTRQLNDGNRAAQERSR